MIEIDNIYNMDCLEGMRQMESESVDLTVTSPPYDNLRKYKGFCFDFENIAKELYRVTKKGGVVVWVVGDATINGSETGTSFRQALYFMECGFKLFDTMIYGKNNPTPNSGIRYQQTYEYMFVLSKDRPKTTNILKEPRSNKWNDKRCFRKEKKFNRTQDGDFSKYKDFHFDIHEEVPRRNIWWYSVGLNGSSSDKIAFEHPATYPEALAADHIRSWCNEGDIVLDPFMGSGTTAKMALTLNRHYIGFEISAEYCQIIEKRLMSLKTQYKLF
jgi:site-specific DNA-methyltransferase (adenine-specific)